MVNQEIVNSLSKISRLQITINEIAINIKKTFPVFIVDEFKNVKFTCSEAGFLKVVTLLYIIYFETSKDDIKFLIDLFPNYNIGSQSRSKEHQNTIHHLRTYFSHFMTKESQQNNSIIYKTNNWFSSIIEIFFPETEEDWSNCLMALLLEAMNNMSYLLNCIVAMSNDIEFLEGIVFEWNSKSDWKIDPYKCDEHINMISNDLGLDYIDCVKFRNKNIDKWRKELSNYSRDIDLYTLLRKMIERDLLINPLSIITGKDILDLGVEPGPIVAHYLKLANEFQSNGAISKEEVILKIKLIIDNES